MYGLGNDLCLSQEEARLVLQGVCKRPDTYNAQCNDLAALQCAISCQ